MSFPLDFKLQILDNTGANAQFTDISLDYGSGSYPDYADINHVRILIGEYNNLVAANELTSGASLEEFWQYLKTAGSAHTYDNKSLSVGNYIIPQTTGLTVASGDTFEQSGYYNPYIDPASWLPTANYTPLVLGYANFGQATSPIMSSLYAIQYEIYNNTNNTFPVAAVADQQYIVYGGVVQYSSNRYRTGEVFIATDTSNITSISGSPYVAKLYATAFKNYFLIYDIERRYFDLVTLMADKNCKCKDLLSNGLKQIQMTIEGLRYAEFSQQVAYTEGWDTILDLQNQLTQLENSNC